MNTVQNAVTTVLWALISNSRTNKSSYFIFLTIMQR